MRVTNADGQLKTSPGLPVGAIVAIYDYTAGGLPAGWRLCDGAGGTPDLRDRFIVGDTAVGTGSSAGSVSATSALSHTGAAVAAHSAHVFTQPAAHSAHIVTQPAAHANHTAAGDHEHDAHTTVNTTAGAVTLLSGPVTHATGGNHTHDAHSAHTGGAVDAHSAHSAGAVDGHSAHSVTQPASHGTLKTFTLAWVMWQGLA